MVKVQELRFYRSEAVPGAASTTCSSSRSATWGRAVDPAAGVCEEYGSMFTYAAAVLCVAQFLFLGKHWMRVTARDRDASRLRQMRKTLDWHRPGHRPRIAAGVPHFGERWGQ